MGVSLFHRFPTVFRVFFLIVGLGTLGVSGNLGKTSYLIVKNGVRVTGQVIEVASRRDVHAKKYLYTPIFRFLDAQGEPHVVRSAGARDKARYAVGDPVPVIYPANDPNQARINIWSELWMPTLITSIIGVTFIFLSLTAHRLYKTTDLSVGTDPPREM